MMVFFSLVRADVFEKALDIFVSNEMLERMSSIKESVLFHLLPFVFLKKKSIDRAKLVVDRLGKSQLKSHWMVKSLRKKSSREGTYR
jgi:predicted nucleotidyltransferase